MSNAQLTASASMADGIANRAQKLRKGPLPYIGVFIRAMPDLWSPTNRAGWIPLVVAENKLANDKILERMQQVTQYPTWVMNYGGMKGSFQLQAAMAALINRTFVPEPKLEIEHMCILAGCSAVLDSMFFCLADAGASVLIPAPYYPAFDNDLKAKCDLLPLPFNLDEDSNVAEQLTREAAEAAQRGNPVKALLVTNPNNPLGTIYREDTVREMILWCLGNEVHYVSDEIYALSVYDPTAPPFISALTLTHRLVGDGALDQEQVDTYVHLVYGLSKDWCGSGLRVGMLYSRNQPLQEALNSLAAFGSISNHTQHVLAEVLSDAQWTDTFVKENSQLLRESYTALTQKLDAVGIPYVHAVAGMFIWIDLRKYLGENTWEGEAALWSKVCEEAKVILTPGESCHASEPGYFRLCFAWVAKEALEDAVTRLQQTLAIS